jgi:2-hydroxychromene-2-carboxylate isomerase
MRSSHRVPERPLFFYDVASPYAYLAASRIGNILPTADWQPILLGGLFKLNGRHSWLYDDDREDRQAGIERRAASYGLPAVTWFRSIPTTWLTVMRAATVAKRRGRVVEFSLAAFRAVHARGRELWHDEQLAELAPVAGLEPDELLEAVGQQDVKDELRATTEHAHELGAPGVPTVVVGGQVFWGDDRLEEAAEATSTIPS